MYTVIKQETLKGSVRQKDRQKIRQKRFSEPKNYVDRSPGRHRDGATHGYAVRQEGNEKQGINERRAKRLERLPG